MIRTTLPLLAALLLASPSLAESHGGDAEAGAEAFSQCQTCHVVVDADGNTLAGKRAKTGPNLYGMVGRQAGTVDGFRYGKSLVEAGEAGLVWDEEKLRASKPVFHFSAAHFRPSPHRVRFQTLMALYDAAGFLVGCIPALRAYRMSLADGLSLRI